MIGKCQDFCLGTLLKFANFIVTGILGLGSFIRFSYLAAGFNFFLLVNTVLTVIMVAALAASFGILGEGLSVAVRTYLNLLDYTFGKGAYICFISTILF